MGHLTPRGHARCNRILDIATALFLKQGYAATSLAQIVAASGGSLSTLYQTFNDKDGLFLAIVHRKAESLFSEIESTRAFSMPLEAGLTVFAGMLMDTLHTPDVIAIHRIFIGEGRRFPALRRALFEKRATLIDKLSRYLRGRLCDVTISIAEADLAARQFIALVWLDVDDGLASGQMRALPARRRREICSAAVTTFLRGARSAQATRRKRS
jgi:AcrR family transcriptional regulator